MFEVFLHYNFDMMIVLRENVELLPWYLARYKTMLLRKSVLVRVNKYLLATVLNTHLLPFLVMRCTYVLFSAFIVSFWASLLVAQ